MKRLILLLLTLSFISLLAPAQNNARMLSGVNAQTDTSYPFVAQDATRLVTFANAASVAATLPSPLTFGFGQGNEFDAQNLGPGAATITCNGCLIFSSNATGSSSISLAAGQGILLFSSGVSYYAVTSGAGGSGSGTVNTGTVHQLGFYSATGPAISGDALLTDNGSTLAYSGAISSAFFGVGNQAACYVDNIVHFKSQDCADFMEGTLGLRSGLIYSRPEIITSDPWTVNFVPDWRISTGPSNSALCDDSGANTNCTVVDAPLIFGGSSLTIGLGPVLSAANMSSGSLIMSGINNFPKPVGKPTFPTATCTGTGGSGGTFHLAEQMVVNLESHLGKTPIAGQSAYATQDITCSSPTSAITIPVPTGGSSGSLTKTDFRVGVATALNGDYYVQQPGVALTCGSAGTVDPTNDCKIAGGAATLTMATIQTSATSFPMATDNKTGQPVDITNPMIVMGANAPVTFLEQFRDVGLACPATNPNGNNPNVLIYNVSGQEGAGTNNGTVQVYGDCGGYSGFTGAFIYSATQTPNSTWSQISISGGPVSGAFQFYGIIADCRPNGVGGASGAIREMNNVTIALKGGGSASIPIEVEGDRCKAGIWNSHFESINGNESVYWTNGAHLDLFNVEGSTLASAPAFHMSSTAGFSSATGVCPQGIATASQERCQTNAIAIQDDTDTTGTQPILGFVAHWASSGSKTQLGNLEVGGDPVFDQYADFVGATSGGGNAGVAGNCRMSFNLTTGVMVWLTSTGSSCGPSGGGSVTSVALTQTGSVFTITGTPVTSSGAINLAFASKAANFFLASPDGTSGALSARAIVNGDLPATLTANTTGTASNLSGTPALPNGATGTTQVFGDNSTKIATDAFVLANAGSSVIYNQASCGATCLGRTTSLGATTMTTAGGSGNVYRFTGYLAQSALGSGCSASPTGFTVQVIYTDPTLGTTTTNQVTNVQLSASGNGTVGPILPGPTQQWSFTFAAKAGTNVQVSTTEAPASGCSPAPAYNFYPTLELLQ